MEHQGHAHGGGGRGEGGGGGYGRFLLMVAAATVVMYALTYANTYSVEHVEWSQTRAWMSLMMGGAMAAVMLTFTLHMHHRRGVNAAVYAGAAAAMALGVWMVRSQVTVDDVSYMRAMIPHHSIAILTSERARITDPRVRKLADGIIETQRREIDEMKRLIAELTAK